MKNEPADLLQKVKTPGILVFTRNPGVFTRLRAKSKGMKVFHTRIIMTIYIRL